MAEATQTIAINSLPQDVIDLIRKNNEYMERLQDRIEAGVIGRWLTVSEAAKYVKMSRSSLLNEYKDDIPQSKRKRSIVYDIKDLDAFNEKRKSVCKDR